MPMLVNSPGVRPGAAGTVQGRRRTQRFLGALVCGLAILLIVPFLVEQPPLTLAGQLPGKWVASHEDVGYDFIFYQGGRCMIHVMDPDPSKRRLYNGSYTLHLNKQPVALSIHSVPGLKHPLHTIVRVDESGRLEMAPFSPVWRLRPTSFDSKTSLVFTSQNS